MFRIVISSSLAAAVALAGAADLQFQTVKSESGRFTAKTPGQPKEATKEGGEHIFDVLPTDTTRYHIGYIDVEGAGKKSRDPQLTLKLFRDGYREGAKFEDDKEITIGANKIPGLEYRLEAEKGVFVRERLFLSGDRIYMVYVVSVDDKDYLDSKDVNKFFDSFAVTK